MTTTTAMPTVTRFTTKAGSTYEINRADYTFSKVVNGRLSNTMNIRTSDTRKDVRPGERLVLTVMKDGKCGTIRTSPVADVFDLFKA